MAFFHGKNGVVKVGVTNVAEVKEFEVDERVDTVDATAMGDTYKKHVVGVKEWNGSLTCSFDGAGDDGQKLLLVGSEVALVLEPDGTVGTDLTGNATITGRKVATQKEGLVELAITFQGNGALTDASVA